MSRELTGRHVLFIAGGALAIVVGANVVMMTAALDTFPGLVVKNSYVASQNWNAQTDAQEALGWKTAVSYSDGRLFVRVQDKDGMPVQRLTLSARVGRPSSDAEDRTVPLSSVPDGFSAVLNLAPGIWRVELSAPDYPAYAQRAEFLVQGTQ